MGEILRHKKTGGLYEVLFRGVLVRNAFPLLDNDEIMVVRDPATGLVRVWPSHWILGGQELIARGKIQTSQPLEDGGRVVVYIARSDRNVWVRPTSEMDDGRFEAADAPQATSSTPGEVERLVDALIEATTEHTYLSALDVGATAEINEALAARDTARTALLSHISTAGRGEGAGDLAALSAAATQGAAQIGRLQDKHLTHCVDFGTPPKAPFMTMSRAVPAAPGFTGFAAGGVCHSDDDSSAANAAFVAALWNAFRSGRLVERSAADATNPQDQE